MNTERQTEEQKLDTCSRGHVMSWHRTKYKRGPLRSIIKNRYKKGTSEEHVRVQKVSGYSDTTYSLILISYL